MAKKTPRHMRVVDDGSLHTYRTEIPNTVVNGQKGQQLTVWSKWLYVYLKRICGDAGECWQGTSIIAQGSGMSEGKVSHAKRELVHAGLITITKGKNPFRDSDTIRIRDIWLQNMQEWKSSPHEDYDNNSTLLQEMNDNLSLHHMKHDVAESSPHEDQSSPHETKKISLRRSLEEEEIHHSPHTANDAPLTPKKRVSRKSSPPDYAPGFLRFWDAYPRKVGKDAAWKAWTTRQLEAQADVIVPSIQTHLDHDPQWREPQYIPHPTTYLNQGRWQDDFSQPVNGKLTSPDTRYLNAQGYWEHPDHPGHAYGIRTGTREKYCITCNVNLDIFAPSREE